MLVLNGIVGAGIFALPGTMLAEFGAFSPWLIPIFGVFTLLVAIPLGEVAGFFERTGGPVAYTEEAFGPFVSFQTGWTYYVAKLSSSAANTAVFAAYAAALWPPLGNGLPRAALIVAVLGAVTAVNVIGVKRAVAVLDALSILKIAPLLLLALPAAILYGFRGGAPIVLPHFDDVERASLLIFYAFVGFEISLVVGGETKDAKRTIPRALIATIVATIALYFIVQFAYTATMQGEAAGAAPLVAFGRKLIGPTGAMLMIFAALFSIAGNVMGAMASSARVTFALAAGGQLPGWFSRVNARYATPANSIVFLGATAMILALSGSFVSLAVVSSLARLWVYLASIAALPVIRRKHGAQARRGPARILAPAVFAGGLLFCLWAISQSTLESWRLFGLLVLAGGILYILARYLSARRAAL